MKDKLSRQQFIIISIILFGMFFGAGNLIFPPMLGKDSGTSVITALIFFTITAIVFPVLGIVVVARTHGLKNLANRVGPIFAILYTVAMYISIGPGIAIPRAGSTPFEMAVLPYISADIPEWISRIVYTIIFFGISYWLCLTPGKMVDRMGKYLTPLLLILIIVLFIGTLCIDKKEIAQPIGMYAINAPVKGFLEGYNTMDTVAALNFGLVVYLSIKSMNINDENKIVSYSIKSGVLSGAMLLLVYVILAYIGATTSTMFPNTENGAQVLTLVVSYIFGKFGAVLLALIFTLACLTTCVGLIMSTGQYFASLTKVISYKMWITALTLISLVLANFGLNTILKFSFPILMAIYPVSLVLIVLALVEKIFGCNKFVYKMTIYTTLFISIVSALDQSDIVIPVITKLISNIPFYKDSLGWLLPTIIAFFGSVIINMLYKNIKAFKTELKTALSYTIPIFFGYCFMGTAFGILLSRLGYGVEWAFIMSTFIYGGSMQFVALGILSTTYDPIACLLLTCTVNCRYMFYGISLINKFEVYKLFRPWMIHTITDETYSLLCGTKIDKSLNVKQVRKYISVLNHLYWIFGCTMGTLIGGMITFDTKGIDFTMTALFLVIAVEQWESVKKHTAAIIGLISPIICRLFLPSKYLVVGSMILIVVLLFIFRTKIEKDEIVDEIAI